MTLNNMEKHIKSEAKKRYLKELKLEMDKMTDIKRNFISDISEDIDEFLSLNKEANIQILYKEFGFTAEIAHQFNSVKDISAFKKKAHKYFVLRIITIIMTVAIVLSIAEYQKIT